MPGCVQSLKLRSSFDHFPYDQTFDSERKQEEKASVEFALQANQGGTKPLTSNKKPFKCKDCWKDRFEAHLTMHSPLKHYVCVVCGGSISSISGIKNHLCCHKTQLHSKLNEKIDNKNCNKKKRPNILRRYSRSHKLNNKGLSEEKQISLTDFCHEQLIQVINEKSECKEELNYLDLSSKYMQRSIDKQENCNIVQRFILVKTTPSSCQIDLNSNIGHSETEINFLCYKCGAGFTTNEDLVQHESIHNDDVFRSSSSSSSSSISSSSSSLLSSRQKSSGPFLCTCCRALFKSKIGLMAHQTLHRSGLEPQTTQEDSKNLKYSGGSYKATDLFCLLCDLVFTQSSDLISHIVDAHPNLPQYVNLEMYNDCEDKLIEKMLHCYKTVENSNRDASNSQQDIETITEQNCPDPGNYFCLLCNFGSSSSDVLAQHIKGAHPNLTIHLEELQTCKNCQFICGSNEILKNHMRLCKLKSKNKSRVRRSKRIKNIHIMLNIISKRTRSARPQKKLM